MLGVTQQLRVFDSVILFYEVATFCDTIFELNAHVHSVTQFEVVEICASPTIVSGDSGARKEARGRRLWPPSWSGTLHIDN